MTFKTILFDLDGTLTDSGEGIIRCAELALAHFSLPIPDRKAMRRFVGPPLRDSFARSGIPADRLEEAVAVFRGRYNTVGKFENFPYPGIRELLEALTQAGHRLYVATSKPEALAVEVLAHFDLARYFTRIYGSTPDGSRETKEAVIGWLLAQETPNGRAVMVGDTAYDVLGAAAHGIPTVGVAWGYGEVDEMRRAGAAAIVRTPEELQTLLCT